MWRKSYEKLEQNHGYFDLHQSRWGFTLMGLQLIWAGIKNTGVIWINAIDCDSVECNGVDILQQDVVTKRDITVAD